jgi:hypothetical protein
MAIDHGLDGRNTPQSQKRRERKAKRTKKLIKQLVQSGDSGSSKKEVRFDEDARVAWLTGFHKRKQERRKFGLTMQVRYTFS